MQHNQSKFSASLFYSTTFGIKLNHKGRNLTVIYQLLKFISTISIKLFIITGSFLFVQNASAIINISQSRILEDSPAKVVTALKVPNPPTNVSAVAGNAQATVSFTPPTNNGGSTITSYTVTSSPGNIKKTGASSPLTVTGLTNGTAYTFTVVATNAIGNSVPSTASTAVTPATVPNAPTSISAVAGNTQATVSFTPPTNNGGSAIIGYTVTSNPGNITKTGTSSPLIVTGLTNGTSYTFTVVATNAIGNSVPSTASTAVTPATVPNVPTSVSAVAGNTQATVSFTAPTNNGGSAITGYTVISNPGNISQIGTASPLTVAGLTNGTSYTFTVVATNAIGISATSAASSVVTPATVPNVPTSVSAVAGNTQATVSFTAPTNNGGSAITGYTVTSNPGNISQIGTASPLTVAGLTNGTSYNFTVVATNAIGNSASSSASYAVIPTAPVNNPVNVALGKNVTVSGTTYSGSPAYLVDGILLDQTNTSRWRGDVPSTIDIDFGTVQSVDSADIYTGYYSGGIWGDKVSAFYLQSWNGSAWVNIPEASISSNTNNHVTFRFSTVSTQLIRLVTPAGASDFARYMEILIWSTGSIASEPDAPTAITAVAGNAQATVTFTAPANNGGSAITGYTVTSNIGNISHNGTASPIIVSGLTNGTAYTFTVVATNAIGNSVPSSASNSVTPVTVPNAPTTISAVAGDSQVTVSFYSPSYNGGSSITGYTVISNPGNITQSGTSSPLTVNGLTNGTNYTFTVVAINAVGNSSPSVVSNTVIPSTPPSSNQVNVALGRTVTVSGTTYSGTPTNLVDGILLDQTNTSRWRGDVPSTVDIDFGTTQSIASADIFTGYFNGSTWDSQVTAFSLQSWNGSSWVNIPGASITGNTSEHVTFNFSSINTQKVRLVTPTGASDFSRYMEIEVWTPSNTPQVTVPDAPINVSAVSGDSQATVTFTAPTNFGGTPITSYTVTSNPGNISKTASASPIYFTSLSNGTSYTFTVIATNVVGNSVASSASTTVTPTSQRVLPTVSTQLLSIYQNNKTDLHMLTSIDSLVNSPSTGTISVYKKNSISYTYNTANIDSIVIINGSRWSDSLKVALDVTRYGVVGDGVTDIKSNLDNAISAARTASANLYFPHGTYYYVGGMNSQNIRFIGESRNNTIIKDNVVTREHNIDGVENMTLRDFYVSDYNTTLTRTFKNCLFNVTLPVSGSFIQQYSGCYTYGADLKYIDCDFIFPQIWIGLYIRKYNSVLVQNCYFSGSSTHNIRLESPNTENANVQILNNSIFGGTTGIFLVSGQNEPLVGGLIQGNKLYSQDEESIAMDGYGNDAGMVPVIANGTIASASNDANGRLVISLNNMLTSSATAATVSSRTDWRKFYFVFGTGSGLDGKYAKIYDYNSTANTLTVDTIISASNIVLTGDAGVESGFFNWTVRGNSVSGTLGSNNTYGTAISLFLNAFGMLVENNTVTNCAHGINVAGGNMINNTRTFAFNNLIQNNTFTDCDRYGISQPSEDYGAVRIISYWGGAGPLQFNNKFINNTVNGGRVFIERQRNFVESGNTYNNVTRLAVDTQ